MEIGVSCNYFYLIAAHEDLNSTHLAEIPYLIVAHQDLNSTHLAEIPY
jgi:hypothetical protein